MEWVNRVISIILWLSSLFIGHPAPTPAATPAATPKSISEPVTRSGVATWYDWRPGQAAAGPGLRRMLGPNWRGQGVRVCAGSRCVRVILTDWCACATRSGRPTLIDLDRRSFARLASPSRGVIEVTVTP